MKVFDYISKPCTVCKKVKPLTSFHRNKDMKDGRLSRCRECVVPRDWSKSYALRKGAAPKCNDAWKSLNVAFQTIERMGV